MVCDFCLPLYNETGLVMAHTDVKFAKKLTFWGYSSKSSPSYRVFRPQSDVCDLTSLRLKDILLAVPEEKANNINDA